MKFISFLFYMKNLVNSLKQGVVIGIGFILIIFLAGVSYAAWVNLTDVIPGDTLTADIFNEVLENQRDLNNRLSSLNSKQLPTAWVQFNGSNGTILDSYNVSSVNRTAVGRYNINFTNLMDNINYVSFADGCSGYDAMTQGELLNSVGVIVWETNNLYHDCGVVSVLVFGGKN